MPVPLAFGLPRVPFDAVIAIERPGMAADGKYYTMTGRDITNLVNAYDKKVFADDYPAVKIGIGDGGNEAGLGSLQESVREHISNGEIIASTTKADHALVASVSNWGGYALALSLELLSGFQPSLNMTIENAVADKIAQEGICDGILQQPGATVDGLDWKTHRKLVKDLIRIAKSL